MKIAKALEVDLTPAEMAQAVFVNRSNLKELSEFLASIVGNKP